MKTFFVTSTGTDIGKTFFVTSACEALIDKGRKVSAIKPVISGFDKASDTYRILRSLSIKPDSRNIEAISPWRYKAALSPDIAARMESKKISLKEVVKFSKKVKKEARADGKDYFFIEGIGGVMVPLNKKNTILDLISKINVPVILVTGNYLGSISHTLNAVMALKSKEIDIHSIILTNNERSGPPIEEVKKSIKNFVKEEIHILPYCKNNKDIKKNIEKLLKQLKFY